ncbi:hypothetical protein HZH68_005703 [Vespula germanica]|uniref:Uncharacterized protein n=1 Tax=Vespula germanica TaxID=30212 RepID=A0A834KK95_VESGE|nr:hypothetical protein HZH68_005703 [Vespula germanica]
MMWYSSPFMRDRDEVGETSRCEQEVEEEEEEEKLVGGEGEEGEAPRVVVVKTGDRTDASCSSERGVEEKKEEMDVEVEVDKEEEEEEDEGSGGGRR